MIFISPYTILRDAQVSCTLPLGKSDLRLLQRILLSEIDLAADNLYKKNGLEWDKDAALAFCETLKDERVLDYHSRIAGDDVLLGFLTDGVLNKRSFRSDAVYQSTGFQSFIMPYYTESYADVLDDFLFQPTDESKKGNLQALPKWWLESSTANKALLKNTLNEWLDSFALKLSQKVAQKTVFDVFIAKHSYINANLVWLFNDLGAAFEQERIKYAKVVFNLIKMTAAKGLFGNAKEYFELIKPIQIDASFKVEFKELEEYVFDLQRQYAPHTKKMKRIEKEATRESPISVLRLVFILVMLCLLVNFLCKYSAH